MRIDFSSRRAKIALYAVVIVLVSGFFNWRRQNSARKPIIANVLPQEQQILKGWGCFPSTFQLDRPNAENFHIFNRPNAQKLIFGELGLSFIRAEILPGSYDARRDDGSLDEKYLDASLVRWLRLGQKWGVKKVLLTVWSPPASFKTAPTTLGIDSKTRQISRLSVQREDDYCRFVVKTLDHLQKRGLPKPLAYSIQNEPNYAPPLWKGCQYDAAQWQRVTKKMRRAFDSGGYQDVPLIGPECGSYAESVEFLGGENAPILQKDAEFARALGGFAYHGYTIYSRRAPFPQQLRRASLQAQKAGLDVWMSEYSIPKDLQSPLDHALETSQRLAREMAFIPTNYWTWWQGWYFQHPKGTVLITGADDKRLHISKTYHVLRKIWHLVPPGSRVHRVATDSDVIQGFAPEMQTVAFRTGRKTTVLIVNPTSQTQSFQLRGLSGTKAEVWTTDATRDMTLDGQSALQNGELELNLAPRSIWVVASR